MKIIIKDKAENYPTPVDKTPVIEIEGELDKTSLKRFTDVITDLFSILDTFSK